MSRRPPIVLLVSDGNTPYVGWLRRFCTVRRAYSGRQARDSLDGVDAVVLDGPVLGFDVGALADAARRLDCRAVAITDASPDTVPGTVETVPRSVSGALFRDALATVLPAAQPIRDPSDDGGTGAGTAVTPKATELDAAAVRDFLA